MYYFRDSGKSELQEEPHSLLRDRANESLDELKNSLGARPHSARYISAGDSKQLLGKSVQPRILTYEDGTLCAPHQSEASSRLQNLLTTPMQIYSPTLRSPVPIPSGPLPSPEEAATLLKNQAVYTSHLEAESRYIKEEIAVLRMKLSEIIEENRTLHNELKTTVVHEIIKEGGDFADFMGSTEQGLTESFANVMNRHDFKRWQVELERLSKLHAAKTDRLESHLQSSKSEVERLEQIVDDLKSQLRIQESIPTHENGMISSVFLTETEKNVTLRTLETVTKERDELMDHVTSLRSQLKQMSHREEEAYQQMKKGIQLVEQAQLEKTEAFVQKEQVCDDMARLRERFEAHVRESQTLVKAERDAARMESQSIIEDLTNKVKEIGEYYAVIQARYDKEIREKATLSAEIIELKSHLRTTDREGTVTSESYRMETTNASVQRNSALYETNRLRSEVERLKHDHDQETSRSRIETDDMRQRLNKAERELVNSKEECIHMTSNIQALERELHLAKMARDSIERGRSDDLKVIHKHAQNREEELKLKMEESEDRHHQTSHEMDTMLLKQNKLIMKLREECKKQAGALEKTVKKYRSENGTLKQQNEELTRRMERLVARTSELEDQEDQHSKVHNKMRERLKSLDEQGQHQAVQLVEALTKYSQTTRDRQLLAREVEFLRTQIHRANMTSPESFRLNSSSKVLVDDILNVMTKEERAGIETLIPELQLQASSDVPMKISLEDLGSDED